MRTAGSKRVMSLGFYELAEKNAHQTHNKGGNHGTMSPLRISVVINLCINCGTTFAGRPTARIHVVNSWSTSHHPSVVNFALRARIWPLAVLLRTCAPCTPYRSCADDRVSTTCFLDNPDAGSTQEMDTSGAEPGLHTRR